MNKNIVNPIAVAMLLLALMPRMGSATTIRNKLVNTNLQLSRPKHRSIISLMLIVTLSASVLMSVMPFEAQAAGGAYTLTWRAADPSSYQKYTPATLACPGDAGRYADPLTNASSLDVVPSLAPSTLALGQIVPFEMIIGVNGDTSPENGVIQFTNEFATNTSSGDNFGYDPAYMVYCAFVDTADPGTIDPGNNATVDHFTSTLVGSGSNQYIQGTFNVSGLDNGDQVVVEIWVVLKSTIPPKSSGTVSTTVDSAQTASGDTINSGKQSTDINKIGQFFTNKADVSVVKTDVPDPVMQGQTLSYTILVENHSPDTVTNGIHVIDTLDTNTTFVSATGAPFTQNGNTLDFSVGFLTPGQNATLTINTIVADTAGANNDTSLTDPEQGSATFPTVYDLLNEVTETAITDDSNTTNNTYYQPTNVLSANAVLTITKTATPATYSAVGEVITYNYQVTNDGNVVVNGLTVTDDKATVALDKDNIAPGESATGTASYTVVQNDIDAGSVTNVAYATGTYDGNKPVKSNEATATVKAEQNAALKLTKEASPLTYNAVDQTITYTYSITNDGNVVVTGLIVADNRTAVTLDKTELAPGESETGTASYTIKQEDINAGSVTNAAFATGMFAGNQVTSNEATATVKKVSSTGQICPTQTTCDQYMSGTSADLTQANYLINSKTNAIKSVSPGVMFYYSTIEISAAGSVDISVAQSNNGTLPAIAIQDTKQVILYDSTCSKISGTKVTTSIDKGSTVNLHADNLQPGTYYLGIKYSLSGLQGYKLISQTYPTVNYTFETTLNGNVISTSKDSIDLVPKAS